MLGSLSKNASVRVTDLDSELNKSLDVETTFDLTNKFSKEYILQEWNRIFGSILDAIASYDKSETNIIVSHVLYYKIFTREFFPLFSSKTYSDRKNKLSNLPLVSHVALVIDDIFDTFSDLNKEKQIFSDSTFLNDYAKSRKLTTNDINNTPTINFDWLSYCMSTILEWRSQEVILAQEVAVQLNSKYFLLWGLKQDPRVLANWALSPSPNTFYLSHPISEPRGDFEQSKTWPEIVEVVNRVQVELLERNIPIVMPTAIDELRFQKKNKKQTGLLGDRWPLPKQVSEMLLSSNLIDKDIDNLDLFEPSKIKIVSENVERERISIAEVQEYADGSLNALEIQILGQLANRDHLIVASTDGIIVLEPWSVSSNRLHSGVGKEIRYIFDTNSATGLKPAKRICVVFSSESVRNIIADKKNITNFKNRYVQNVRKKIRSDHDLSDEIVDTLIDDDTNLVENVGALGPNVRIPDIGAIKSSLPVVRKQACVHAFVEKALLISGSALDFTDLLIVGNMADILKDSYFKIFQEFLSGGKPDRSYESEILSIAKDNGINVP